MFNKDYWNNRTEKYGHTGHAEPFHYCFDQEARLFAIDKILKGIKLEKQTALDFGCGSGDFIELLSLHFKKVNGVDLSEKVVRIAQERFKHSDIEISCQLPNSESKNQYDCILTVTVLQTFTHDDLERTIPIIAGLLNEKGKLICMEFFSTEEYNRQSNENRVTHADWAKVLHKYGLKIETAEGFYNPVLFPTRSWREYSTSLFLNLLKLFKHRRHVQKLLIHRARKIIHHHKDVYPYTSSPFKVFIIKKESTVS